MYDSRKSVILPIKSLLVITQLYSTDRKKNFLLDAHDKCLLTKIFLTVYWLYWMSVPRYINNIENIKSVFIFIDINNID